MDQQQKPDQRREPIRIAGKDSRFLGKDTEMSELKKPTNLPSYCKPKTREEFMELAKG